VNTFPASTVFTDLLGTCEVNEILSLPEDGRIRNVIAILKVTVANIATVVDIYHSTNNPSEIIEISYIRDTVTLEIPEEDYPFDQPNEADWVCNIAAYYGPEDVAHIYSGGTEDTDKITWGERYKTWSRDLPGIQYTDPALVIFVISCVPKGEEGEGQGKGKGIGRTPILIVGSGPNGIKPKGVHFGSKPFGTTANVQRNVIISKMLYLVQMTLWKETL